MSHQQSPGKLPRRHRVSSNKTGVAPRHRRTGSKDSDGGGGYSFFGPVGSKPSSSKNLLEKYTNDWTKGVKEGRQSIIGGQGVAHANDKTKAEEKDAEKEFAALTMPDGTVYKLPYLKGNAG